MKGQRENIGVCNWRYERIQAMTQYANRHELYPIRFVQTWQVQPGICT